MDDKFISVITPTYNRELLLHRVFNSLSSQTYHNFEWIIIDDGSTDNTRTLVEEWTRSSNFRITYNYQVNSGKHIAVNKAVKLAKGYWIILADSDDSFRADSLEFFINQSIDISTRLDYCGVSCRCYGEDQKSILGSEFPKSKYIFDCRESDLKYRYKVTGELWGMVKRDVLLEFPFKEIINAKFYPESIIWDNIGNKYITRYINEPLRYYHRDAKNSITKANTYIRYNENYYLWIHNINENSKYLIYSPKMVIKSYIGFSMDSINCNMKFFKSLKEVTGLFKRLLCILFYPLGFIAHIMKE